MTTRKRVRSSCEEECCDFMPLSKKINNLHINNNSCTSLGHAVLQQVPKECSSSYGCGTGAESGCVPTWSMYESDCSNSGGSPNPLPGSSNSTPPYSGFNGEPNWIPEEIISLYSPDLSLQQNPYYYENNKLLFALYVQRMQRVGQELY